MNEKTKTNTKLLMILSLGFLFLLRLINLDADLPPWGIVNYQPMDEGQYAMMALNKINYDSLRLDFSLENNQFLTSAHIRNNVIGNFFVYLGLLLFGDNYYGFRCSSVLVGLVNFVLFCIILRKIERKYSDLKNEKKNRFAYITLVLLFLCDFVYTVACRVVETSIYRMLFLQLIIFAFYIFEGNEFYESKGRFFISGFLSVVSVFAVYITNIFIPVAIFFTIIFCGISKGKKYFLNGLMSFIAGCGLAYVTCDLYYNFVWGTSCIVNTMQIIKDFSGISGYTNGNYFTPILNFFSSNSNLYNISFLFLVLLVIPIVVKKIFKEKDINNFFLVSCVTALLLQTIINEDYIVRKYIIIYPIAIYLFFYFWVNNPIIEVKNYFSKHKILKIMYSIFCIFVCVFLVMYRLFFIENSTYKDFSIIDRCMISVQLVFLFIIGLVILFCVFRKKKCFQNVLTSFLILVVLGCTLTNVYFSAKYIYLNDSYTEKDVMVKLGETVGDDYVYGIYSIAFTLYNDIKPVVNAHDIQGEEINEQNIRWYLDYSNFMFPEEILGDRSAEWNELEIYKRNFSTFGKKNSVSLYEIIH